MNIFGSHYEYKPQWREDRLPLIMQMYEEDIPPTPGSNNKSDRSRNICNGTTMIMGRWPRNITVLCITFAIAIILMVITALSFLLILSSRNNTSHELVTKKESKVLQLETRCDYQEAEDEILNNLRRIRSKNILNSVGFQHTSSYETERNDTSNSDSSISTEHKVFFVSADDTLSSHQLCAVESAARFTSSYNLYVIILSINNNDNNTLSDKRFDELLNTYPKVKVFRLKGDRYFYDSPMKDILYKSNFSSSLIVFAARVLTLWRYGGITYDLNLITLDNNSSRTYPVPVDASLMISRHGGAVMGAGRNCHAFLYNTMTSLTSLYGKRHGSSDLCSNDVLKYTLKKFCHNGNEKSRTGTQLHKRYSNNCNGISAMPNSKICNEDEENKTKCVWTSSTEESYHFRKNLCPVSYRQHTPEETSKANVIALYEKKYILFH